MEVQNITIGDGDNNYTYNKTFNLKNEDTNYILELKTNSSKIEFSLYKENENLEKFGNSYSLNDLVNIDRSFAVFKSIEESRKQIEDIILSNKYVISLNNNNEISFIIKVVIFTNVVDIKFILKKAPIIQSELNIKMNTEIQNLKKEINELKNENNSLKNDIKELQNENTEFKNDIKELKKNIKELEEFIKFENNNNQNDDNLFKFKFKQGKNYTLNEKGNIATRNDSSGFDCTIIGDKEIPKNKISKWKLKINFESSFIIGVGPDNPNNEIEFYRKCWTLDCRNKKLILKSGSYSDYINNKYKDSLKKGDIITVEMNRINNTLSFSENQKNYGIASSEIPGDISLFPIVIIYGPSGSVEIVD